MGCSLDLTAAATFSLTALAYMPAPCRPAEARPLGAEGIVRASRMWYPVKRLMSIPTLILLVSISSPHHLSVLSPLLSPSKSGTFTLLDPPTDTSTLKLTLLLVGFMCAP
eukprot:CAMPEP_0114153520 /NCGR_PEP_ID=MMETSP0043_2-20121206/24403_1 /TAXON_ID=464988 /ORGANISM="Hemiselmis andersenii, Strain CCMP644" /LENGTH=109 /DNA_ID=CAMNT_0001248569 /DNA_START=198 /DNA_END=527 /DNA_ORIENTATION=+